MKNSHWMILLWSLSFFCSCGTMKNRMDPALYNLGPKGTKFKIAHEGDSVIATSNVGVKDSSTFAIFTSQKSETSQKETHLFHDHVVPKTNQESKKISSVISEVQKSKVTTLRKRENQLRRMKRHSKKAANPFVDMIDAIGSFFFFLFVLLLVGTAITAFIYLSTLGFWWVFGTIFFVILDLMLTDGQVSLFILLLIAQFLLSS